MRNYLLTTLLIASSYTFADSANNSYASMCMTQGVKIPVEYGGEADLKGNPKLKEYCECFSDLFTERMMRASKNSSNPPSLEQSKKEEKEMRASCRKKFDLPALK